MAPAKILIVEGEPVIRELVGMLVEAGFQPLLAGDAADAQAVDERHRPDLAIVDVDLGRAPCGLDPLRDLKALRNRPVILLSGLSAVDTRVSGLELGTDDSISKPFGDADLIARVRAHLRRVHGTRVGVECSPGYDAAPRSEMARPHLASRRARVVGEARPVSSTGQELAYSLISGRLHSQVRVGLVPAQPLVQPVLVIVFRVHRLSPPVLNQS
jgi:DNA-binding response OmpR family regulator